MDLGQRPETEATQVRRIYIYQYYRTIDYCPLVAVCFALVLSVRPPPSTAVIDCSLPPSCPAPMPAPASAAPSAALWPARLARRALVDASPREEAARTSVKPPAPVGAAATAPPPLRLPPPSPSESDGAGSDSGSAPSSKSKSSVSAKLRIGAKRPYPSACAAAASVGTDQVLSHCAYSYLGTITQYRHRPSLISLSFGIKYPGTAELLRGRDLIH
jgi:hypothetical protein